MRLTDTFQRQFPYVRLSLTEACNYRCHYCLPDGYQGKQRGFLTLTEIQQLVQGLTTLGVTKIRLTGGEPSLRKDLAEVIALLRDAGITHRALTTNGYRLEQQIHLWQNAGLNALNVSLDTLDPNTFHSITGQTHLASILRGIQQAMALGIPVKVNAVLLKGITEPSMTAFLAWLKDTPIELRFIELMQAGKSPAYFAQYQLAGEPLRQSLLAQGWQPLAKDPTAGPAQTLQHPDYQGKIGFILPYGQDFCAECNRLRISAQGKLHLCLFGEGGIALRDTLQPGQHAALVARIQQALIHKPKQHFLQQGLYGTTSNLSLLGG